MIKKRTKNYWENMKRIEITAMQYNLKNTDTMDAKTLTFEMQDS